MAVAFFSNQFADIKGHGIARYSRELYNALKGLADIEVIPVAAWSSCEKPVLEQLKKKTGLQILPLGRKFTPMLWAVGDIPPIELLISSKIDLVHAVSLGYPISTRKPYVVTVHDIGPLTHPQYFQNKPTWIMKRALDQMLAKADAIVCVSQATADDLSFYAGKRLKSDRLHIIGEGVSTVFLHSPEDENVWDIKNMPPYQVPYFLVTGQISPRKNVSGVLKAFLSVKDEIPHHLVLAGGIGWDAEEVLELVNHPEIRNRVHMLGYVSDSQLRALYQEATAYIHPSLFEGFGLTILEAMASGCPVITSNRYSLPEVAGDATLFVDPQSIEQIATALISVCKESGLADELRQKGFERVKKYSWTNIAKKMNVIYEGLA